MSGLSLLEIALTTDTVLRIDGVGIDVYRDWAGRIVIPATILKGEARGQVRRLTAALGEHQCDPADPCSGLPCVVCRLFGSRRREGAVLFADLMTTAIPIRIDRLRIARSRTRGVSLPSDVRQMLVLPSDTVFEGLIRHRLTVTDPQPLSLLVAGLRGIRQIGTGAALGWGHCEMSVRGAPIAATVFKSSKQPTD